MMLASQSSPGMDHIHSLLDALSNKLVDLPDPLKESIEADLQNIRADLSRDIQQSHQHTQEILDSITDGFLEIDRDWRFTYLNRRSANNVGYEPEDLIGKNLWEEFPAYLGTEIETIYRKVMEDRRPVQMEIHGRLTGRDYEYRFYPSQTGLAIFWTDLTERKRAEEARIKMEEALANSERRYRELIQYAPSGIYEIDFRTGKFTSVNDSMVELSGYTREELLQMPASNLMDEEGRLLFQQRMRKWLSGEKPDANVEYRVKAKDGHTIYALLDVTFTKDANGQPLGATVIGHDITERKLAEAEQQRLTAAVQQERDRLYALINSITDEIWFADADGNVTLINQAVLNEFGEAFGDRKGIERIASSFEVYRADGTPRPVTEAPPLRALHGETVINEEEIVRTPASGELRYRQVNASPMRGPDGAIIGSVSIIRDITERKRAEDAEREHRVQMELQRRLLDYRDQERQALARELHDGPVQDLSSLLFNIQFAKEAISDLPMQLELDKIAAALRDAVQNLRDMINEMRPPSLIRFGLAKALNVFLDEFREKHPEIQFNTSLDDIGCLPEQSQLSLFRIVQEALANILKHAYANHVNVTLGCAEHQVTLEIRDDGKGFTIFQNLIDYSSRGHYGLVGMKERAEAIGADFQVHSSPGEGTVIQVAVPLNHEQASAPTSKPIKA